LDPQLSYSLRKLSNLGDMSLIGYGNCMFRKEPNFNKIRKKAVLTVTEFNDFNDPAQTTNLGVRSSNLFGRAILEQKCPAWIDGQACQIKPVVYLQPA